MRNGAIKNSGPIMILANSPATVDSDSHSKNCGIVCCKQWPTLRTFFHIFAQVVGRGWDRNLQLKTLVGCNTQWLSSCDRGTTNAKTIPKIPKSADFLVIECFTVVKSFSILTGLHSSNSKLSSLKVLISSPEGISTRDFIFANLSGSKSERRESLLELNL